MVVQRSEVFGLRFLSSLSFFAASSVASFWTDKLILVKHFCWKSSSAFKTPTLTRHLYQSAYDTNLTQVTHLSICVRNFSFSTGTHWLFRSEYYSYIHLVQKAYYLIPNLLVLFVLESSLIVEMPNLVLSGPKDGDIVVNDGVFWAGRRQLELDSCFFCASKLSLVNVVPAVALVVLKFQCCLSWRYVPRSPETWLYPSTVGRNYKRI